MGENIVLAAKRVSAGLVELTAPEIAEFVTGTKGFNSSAKSVVTQTLRKQLGFGSGKGTASRVFPTESIKQSTRSRRLILPK